MGEAVRGVNVQALAAFFSKHFEQAKANTQPRQEIQKNNPFLKLLEFSSKPDLTSCKNSDSSSICRSVSSFDLPNSERHPYFATKCQNLFKRKEPLSETCITSTQATPSVVSSRTKLFQDNNCTLDTTSNDSGVDCVSKELQSLQYDSGVEENSGSCTFEDSRTGDEHNFCSVNNIHPIKGLTNSQNSLPGEDNSKICGRWPPAINVVKEPSLEVNKCLQSEIINERNVVTTVWNRTYEVDINTEIEKSLVNKLPDRLFYSEIVVSDNYVCKTQFRRTEIPSTEVLGPPPCKPKKPDVVKFSFPSLFLKSLSFQKQISLPKMEGKSGGSCVPMQHTNELSKQICAQEHSDHKFRKRTLSDTSMNISHFHQHQKYFTESADELNKCKGGHEVVTPPPPSLPPRRLSFPSFLSKKTASIPDIPGEELYQDAGQVEDENLYEEVPFQNDCESHIYVNHEKSSRIARLLQKENRERIRQEKELEKLKRKFGITGEEVPLEKGCIKKDAKGGRGDLAVKKGESVLIVRIIDNPKGRLLVQNDKGKIGYVSLENLIVDADSIKTVMKEQKHLMSKKERAYSNNSLGAYATAYGEC